MDWLAWLLAGTVIVYVGVYTYKCLSPLLRFNKVKDTVSPIEGKVDSLVEETKKAFNGQLVILAYPMYKYELEGKSKYLQSIVKYRNINVGQSVALLYSKETGEVWAKNDIPLMKRQLIIRVSIILIVTLVMIVESTML
jgi:hypothetical protein